MVAARRKNPALGVTGLLLYSNGMFIQMLEGEKSVVTKLYNKILLDTRHHKEIILFHQDDLERDFGDWSMGFIAPNEDEINEMRSFIAEEKFKEFLDKEDAPMVEMMKRVYKRNAGISDL